MQRFQQVAWWPNWRKETLLYFSSCDRCQKANKATGKRYGLLQRIEEPTKVWEVINMDFVTGLSVVGHMNHNEVLVLVCRKTKKCKFLPTYKEATALDTALLYHKHIFF